MSQLIGSVSANMRRISAQANVSNDNLLSEAMEDKLYYHRDTCSPVEFADLVDVEVRRLKETAKLEQEITFKHLIRSFKGKLYKIFR
jgi:hypothetical protein